MKAGRLLLAAAAVGGLAACTTVTPVQTTEVPNGYRIQCHNLINMMENCYSRARIICPKGFELIDEVEGLGRVIYERRYYDTDIQRSIVVTCD